MGQGKIKPFIILSSPPPNISTALSDVVSAFPPPSIALCTLQIAKYCPGRSDNAIKNRYHATCRNKSAHVDLSDLQLPLFVMDAEAVCDSVRAKAPLAFHSFFPTFVALSLRCALF